MHGTDIDRAGFFPGAVFLLSQWYPPHMTQFRMSLLYCAAALSGAFSGLMAAGIAEMKGIGGYNGWRWIFLIEGLLTVLLGVGSFWLLPDSPEHSRKWLKDEEVTYLNLLHRRYRGSKQEQAVDPDTIVEKKKEKRKQFYAVMTDWQLYLQAFIFMASAVPTYALKFTLPQIIVNMGFTSTTAQLLSAPPYIAGALSAVTVATFSDRSGWRLPFICVPLLMMTVSYAVLFSFSDKIANHVALCYTFVVITTMSVYNVIPGGNTWTLNNLPNPNKRALGIALVIGVGNIGGIVGSFIFLSSESPRYQTGWGTCLGFIVLGIVAACSLEVGYTVINKKRGKLDRDEILAKYDEAELHRMGDRSPLFKYTL
jgi:predicted MFS family arabinose efflux permease